MVAPMRAVITPRATRTARTAAACAVERPGEHDPVQPGDGVEPELDHHPGEEDAHGHRSHGVGVGEPEVQGHGRRLGEKAHEEQHHGHDHEGIGVVGAERGADLGHVQRAGAGVEHAHGQEHGVARDAVGDGEVDRALNGRLLLDPVGGEGKRGRAHDLEEDDQVEQVAGQAEAHHAGHEQQHEAVKEALDGVEVAHRIDERGGDQEGREAASPAPSKSMESEMPRVTPWRGLQPPTQ